MKSVVKIDLTAKDLTFQGFRSVVLRLCRCFDSSCPWQREEMDDAGSKVD